MNKRLIVYILGWVLIAEGATMQIPAVTSFAYGEHEGFYFVGTGAVCALLGLAAVKIKKPKNAVLYQKTGFAATALAWIVMSFAGCFPFWLSGEIPNFLDAFYETVSGFTTTGSTVLTDVEALSHGMLMWRSFLNWLGGMGVIVFLLAIIPRLGGEQSMFLMKAESPGPVVGKAVPKMRNYAMLLYGIYFGMTAVELILLLVGGMPAFDAFNISFTTAGTGGFSVTNAGLGGYSRYVQNVVAVFMVLFSVNFSVYILLLGRKFKHAFKYQELWVYLGIMALATVLVGCNVYSRYDSAGDAFHQSFFYVSAILSTTGFYITDVNNWPQFSQTVIIVLTFIGAMAGSTGCGFKVSRIILLFKEVRKEFSLLVHPRNVKIVKMNGKTVDHAVMRSTSMFLVLYVGIFALSWLLISFNELDFTTNFTAVAASLNNTGQGLGTVAPTGNYSSFDAFSKIVLIFDMLAGRLELFPLMLLFSPSTWKKA